MPAARTVTLGLCTDQNEPWEVLLEKWQRWDAMGVASLWDCDHYQQPSRPDGPYYEGWTLLAALAARTTRARIGVLVSSNTFRHPALLAKQATTIDHVSGGRLEVGLGAGWYAPEHSAFGIPFPDPPELVATFKEAVQVVDLMLRNEVVTFDGHYYQLAAAPSRPQPLQKPRPPLTLGAHGPKMLAIVARYADRWNSHGTVEEIRDRSQRLDQLCEEIGRNPSEIRHSLYGWVSLLPYDPWQSLDAFDHVIGSYRDAGINEFVFDAPRDHQFEVLERIAAERGFEWNP